VTDLDGNVFYDLTGSYGVNVFGYDFYKECMARGSERPEALGPVLGAYHPACSTTSKRLQAISGLDEVSFHMSGTEAVMQAVRLARYHTGRSHLVRFCGAYHGWWGTCSPASATRCHRARPTPSRTWTATACACCARARTSPACWSTRCRPCTPTGAPGDSSLVDSGRRAGFDRAAYTGLAAASCARCARERGIVLIFDEVFVGFRLAPGGAQEYFGVQADMVTYGKTLGGGLPVGVVCGRRDLMKRYRDDRPADICFARGTFNPTPT
jgi:glutamate-1-semialdehyde 2,1-aminomutase